jgi:short-subunit dehydrogenase
MKIVLITGVSSGFGLALSRKLNMNGHRVYGTVRRPMEQPVEGINYLITDVTDAKSVKSAVDQLIEKEGRIDVLINNAGTGIAGAIEHTSDEDAMGLMNVNFFGVHRFTRAVLPHMRRQKNGRIIYINSIGGLMGLPYQGFYSASKFAVEGYCQALRNEVKKYNIQIVSIFPGDFFTAFTPNRRILVGDNPSGDYSDFRIALKIIERNEKKGLLPEHLADKVQRIINLKDPAPGYVIASPMQKLGVIIKQMLPKRTFAYILRKFYKIH